MRLKTELNVMIGVAAAVTLAGLGTASGLRLRHFYRIEVVEAKGRAMARALASPCAKALERGDETQRAELEALIADLERARDPVGDSELDLDSVVVLDASGNVFATTGGKIPPNLRNEALVQQALAAPGLPQIEKQDRWGPNGEALVAIATGLRSGGKDRGVLWFSLSLERARSLYWQTVLTLMGAITLCAFVVWFCLYKVLKRRILFPIMELSRGIERVRSGDLTARVTLERKDEFGSLVASFNDMVVMVHDKLKLEQRLDEAERTEAAYRRLSAAHKELADLHTELKATQERLVLAQKQESIGRLVKSVAHELKNPLNMASNALPSLEATLGRLRAAFQATLGKERSTELDEDMADLESAVGVLQRAISRATAIIHDLQGFTQLGTADLSPVDLRRVIDDAALACQTALGPDGRVRLDVDVAGEQGKALVLTAFPTLLAQVFVNLFTNAAQAIEGPGAISVIGRVHGDRARIEVSDTGPGIPRDHLARLFEPFFTTKGVAGTGLGLALCYAYLEKHGGTIEARSEAGRGAVFTIDLPLVAKPAAVLGPRASAIFEGATDSVAQVARGRRGG